MCVFVHPCFVHVRLQKVFMCSCMYDHERGRKMEGRLWVVGGEEVERGGRVPKW